VTLRQRAVAALLLLGLAGCGAPDTLSRSAAARLQPQVAAIRTAAVSGDRAGALAAAAQLRQMVADLRRTDGITAKQASEVLAAAAQVEAQLALLSAPETTSTTTETTEPDRRHRGKDKGEDKGED
jgi:hypothetical protein